MDMAVVSWILNGILGVCMWLLKNTYDDLKEQIKENRTQIARVKDTSMQKEDFTEFKQELWNRLDRFEDSVNAKLL